MEPTKKEVSDIVKKLKLDPSRVDDWVSGKVDTYDEHVLDENGNLITVKRKLTKGKREFAKKIQKQFQDLLDM